MIQRTALRLAPPPQETSLQDEIYSLLRDMSDPGLMNAGIIPWSSPVPVFGDPAESIVATVGLNPSNREFVDQDGHELLDGARRFHTLKSLQLHSWAHANRKDAEKVTQACRSYFQTNPYDLWFKALDRLIQGTGASFYPSARAACHLDLVPFATV